MDQYDELARKIRQLSPQYEHDLIELRAQLSPKGRDALLSLLDRKGLSEREVNAIMNLHRQLQIVFEAGDFEQLEFFLSMLRTEKMQREVHPDEL